jgi:hypothetical protein
MILRSYVLDCAVNDVPGAIADIKKLLGMDAYPMPDDADPSGQLEAGHFPVGGINALGIMGVKGGTDAHPENDLGQNLKEHGERMFLLGFLVDDIDQQVLDLRDAGVTPAYKAPVPYADGRLMTCRPVHGTVLEFAQHLGEEITDRWAGRRAEASGAFIERAYRADVIVDDLEAATKVFTAAFDIEAASCTNLPESLRGVSFPVDGLEEIRLLAVDGAPTGGYAGEIAAWLAKSGEGPMTAAFLVPDLDRTRELLQESSVRVIDEIESAEARSVIAGPLHGVVFEFTERQ